MNTRAFITGVSGLELTAPEREFIRAERPWGFILFRRNVETPEQVIRLLRDLRETVGEPDVYGRILARCLVNGQSLNEQLVSRGFAIARLSESTDYVAAEETAKEKT